MPPGASDKMIERLSFAESQPHEPIEAAIHLARYLVARSLCAGKRVLDVACGEGYGSHFMATSWGARSVHGVDVSQEAVDRASALFGSDQAAFHCLDVAQLDQTFPAQEFDLVVSLETIEHLNDPLGFLESIRRLLAPGGAALISCPNDHWYYRTPEERNPFHVRKYTFDEFRAMAEQVLGPARCYLLGTPVSGFINVGLDSPLLGRSGVSRMAMFEARNGSEFLAVPTTEAVSPANCSYFVGLWGVPATEEGTSAALVPCSMDQSGLAHLRADVESLRDQVVSLRTQLHAREELGARLEATALELRNARLLLLAVTRESDLMRAELQRAQPPPPIPRDAPFMVRLRWALSNLEPVFPWLIGPLRRVYRRLVGKR